MTGTEVRRWVCENDRRTGGAGNELDSNNIIYFVMIPMETDDCGGIATDYRTLSVTGIYI